MNRLRLLRALILKEIRTTLRERNQLLGLLSGIVVFVLALCFVAFQIRQGFQSKRPILTTAPVAATLPASMPTSMPASQPSLHTTPWSARNLMILRWGGIGMGAGLSIFFSLGFLISATLACFVGEKEARTLEILLASPVPDNTLYLFKCLSVLLPMAAVGYLFALIGGIIAPLILGPVLSTLPVNLGFYALVASVPFVLLLEICLVGVGAAISARAQTMKGAGQALGSVVVVVMFSVIYGGPLLINYTPLGRPAHAFFNVFLELPFSLQYLVAFAVLLIPATAFMLLGRAAFQRDRLL